MKEEKKKGINPFILITIYLTLTFGLLNILANFSLALWGSTVSGNLTSYQSVLENPRGEANRQRRVSKTYAFKLDGREYRGFTTYYSSEAYPNLDDGETRPEIISYLPICPYINKPEMLVNFTGYGAKGWVFRFMALVGIIFLFVLIYRTNRKERGKGVKTRGKGAKTKEESYMYCVNCGKESDLGADFCSACGHSLDPRVSLEKELEDYDSSNLVGFSERYYNPEILEAAAKNRRFSVGCLFVLVLLPLILFPIAGLLMESFPFGEAIVVGIVLSLVFLVIGLIVSSGSRKQIWDGYVIKKYYKDKRRDEGDGNYSHYRRFTLIIEKDNGRKARIVGDNQREMYDYFEIGDRIRYHPNLSTYEKYDKSKDTIIYCNVCRLMNPISNDRCRRCDNLLFK